MASNNQRTWNIEYARKAGECSLDLMNSIMMRGGEQEEARVLNDHNMDPSKTPWLSPLSTMIMRYVGLILARSFRTPDHGDKFVFA